MEVEHDANDDMKVTLRSMPDEQGNQREFQITFGAGKLADLIRDAVGEVDDDDEEYSPVVDIMRVKGDCLAKVVDFLNHYKEEPMKEIPTPLGGSSFNEVSQRNIERSVACLAT